LIPSSLYWKGHQPFRLTGEMERDPVLGYEHVRLRARSSSRAKRRKE
jgi:hypothetical protein